MNEQNTNKEESNHILEFGAHAQELLALIAKHLKEASTQEEFDDIMKEYTDIGLFNESDDVEFIIDYILNKAEKALEN